MKHSVSFKIALAFCALAIGVLEICSIFVTPSGVCAFDDGDWQIWSNISIEGALWGHAHIYLDQEFRIGDGMSDLYFHRSDVALLFRFTGWLDLGMNYWHQYTQAKDGSWVEEKKPHLNGTFKGELGKCKIKDRNRLEYRIFQGRDEVWRYRNRLTVEGPFSFTAYRIKPYIADEVFIDLEEHDFNRNRIYGGFTFQPLKTATLDLFYMLQSDEKDGAWQKTNVMGSSVKVKY
jgi:hypothetical protein